MTQISGRINNFQEGWSGYGIIWVPAMDQLSIDILFNKAFSVNAEMQILREF